MTSWKMYHLKLDTGHFINMNFECLVEPMFVARDIKHGDLMQVMKTIVRPSLLTCVQEKLIPVISQMFATSWEQAQTTFL